MENENQDEKCRPLSRCGLLLADKKIHSVETRTLVCEHLWLSHLLVSWSTAPGNWTTGTLSFYHPGRGINPVHKKFVLKYFIFKCVHVHISLCVCVSVCDCVCIYVHLSLCLSLPLSVSLSLWLCLSLSLCVSVCVCVYVCVYLCVSVCLSLCICVCICASLSVCLSLCVSKYMLNEDTINPSLRIRNYSWYKKPEFNSLTPHFLFPTEEMDSSHLFITRALLGTWIKFKNYSVHYRFGEKATCWLYFHFHRNLY